MMFLPTEDAERKLAHNKHRNLGRTNLARLTISRRKVTPGRKVVRFYYLEGKRLRIANVKGGKQ